jgi:hypothetical protein
MLASGLEGTTDETVLAVATLRLSDSTPPTAPVFLADMSDLLWIILGRSRNSSYIWLLARSSVL